MVTEKPGYIGKTDLILTYFDNQLLILFSALANGKDEASALYSTMAP